MASDVGEVLLEAVRVGSDGRLQLLLAMAKAMVMATVAAIRDDETWIMVDGFVGVSFGCW